MKHLILLFSFTALLMTACNQEPDSTQKPNVLFILMDDLGYGQLGINNDTLETEDFDPFYRHLEDSLQGYSMDKALEFTKRAIPTITELSKNGIRFTRAHTTCNVCAPSRQGIATGNMQMKYGVYTNGGLNLVPGTHLAENFQKRGYQTAHIGKWHMGVNRHEIRDSILRKYGFDKPVGYRFLKKENPEAFTEIIESGYYGSVIDKQHPLNNGFDYYYGYNYWGSQFYNSHNVWENFKHAGRQEGYNTDVFTDVAMGYMEEQIDAGKPFYLDLHYHAVHDSLEPRAPDKYFNKFDSDNYHLNNFYAHINGVDCNIQRIVDFLKSKGAYENTLLMFTSDNGAMSMGAYNGFKTGSPLPANAPFSGHKGTYYQGGIRVPMFIHWPDGIEKTGVSHQIVSTMDILPTAIDVTGGTIPEGIDGRSLAPLFRDPDGSKIHDHLIWAGSHATNQGFLVQKTNKTHGTAGAYGPAAWVVIQGDFILRFEGTIVPEIYYEYWDGRGAVLELYNIKKDPAERINIADQFPEKVREMAEIYFAESTDFTAPVRWNQEKYQELLNSEKLFE